MMRDDILKINVDTYACFDCKLIPSLLKNHAAPNVVVVVVLALSREVNAVEAEAPNLLKFWRSMTKMVLVLAPIVDNNCNRFRSNNCNF